MNTPIVSVIVPIYNSERTLEQCVNSILNQEFKDFELLLVDDGSIDSSPSICKEFALKDQRVQVFYKANGGVSSARNVGLKSARGKWITFVDSDDFIDDNYFDNISGLSDDLLLVPYTWYKEGEREKDPRLQDYYEVYGDEDMRAFLNRFLTTLILRGPCAKFYNKSLIGDICFNEKMKVGEDIVFVHNYLLLCNSIRCFHGTTYCVRLSETMASVKYGCNTEYAIESLMYIFESFGRVLEKWKFDRALFSSYLLYFKMISKNDWRQKPSRWYRNAHIIQLYRYVWPYLTFKQKIKHRIACIYSIIKCYF